MRVRTGLTVHGLAVRTEDKEEPVADDPRHDKADPHPGGVIWEDDERTLTTEQVERAELWGMEQIPGTETGNVRHVVSCLRDALAEALEVMALDREELVRLSDMIAEERGEL
jgi:hypothetical protein